MNNTDNVILDVMLHRYVAKHKCTKEELFCNIVAFLILQ